MIHTSMPRKGSITASRHCWFYLEISFRAHTTLCVWHFMTPAKPKLPIIRATPTWLAHSFHHFIVWRIRKTMVGDDEHKLDSMLITWQMSDTSSSRTSPFEKRAISVWSSAFLSYNGAPSFVTFLDDLLTNYRGEEGMTASYIKSALSKSFKGGTRCSYSRQSQAQLIEISVYSSAKCPPPLPSTFLTKHLQEQGIKLRTKKTQNPQ